MAGDEGVGPVPIDQMDAMDQAAMQQAQAHQFVDNMPSMWGGAPASQSQDSQAIQAVQDRANAKQQLAQAQSAGTSMRVDPEHVDDLANFFDQEAEALESRSLAQDALASIMPPGNDPVSTQAARIYSQVGAGDDRAYVDNYLKLAQVFHDTAQSLRDSAKQTRTSEQDAADQFKGDIRA